jgi:hypothetical protein
MAAFDLSKPSFEAPMSLNMNHDLYIVHRLPVVESIVARAQIAYVSALHWQRTKRETKPRRFRQLSKHRPLECSLKHHYVNVNVWRLGGLQLIYFAS